MQLLHAFVLAALLVAAPPGSRPAAAAAQAAGQAGGGPRALYYADAFMGEDPVAPALQAKGYAVDRPASWPEFTAMLLAGAPPYALAVALRQSHARDTPRSEDVGAATDALAAHLAAGRAAWLVDWSGDDSVGEAFGGYANLNGGFDYGGLNITDPRLAAGLPNPLPVRNAGWPQTPGEATFSWTLMPIAHFSKIAALFSNRGPFAVALGNEGRSAVLGFAADALAGAEGRRFFENLVDITVPGPPVIQPPITVDPPTCVAAVNAPVKVTVRAADANGDLVSAWLRCWGDDPPGPRTSFEPVAERTMVFNHAYSTTGAGFLATANAKDARGATASLNLPCLMRVYNPADAAQGRGWVNSPPGAYRPDPSLVGRASFAKMRFKSSSLDWLVLSYYANKGTLQGAGTVNGKRGYRFWAMLIDGEAPEAWQMPGSGDRIRVKIFDKESGATVYDNQVGLEGPLDNGLQTFHIQGGNITPTRTTKTP